MGQNFAGSWSWGILRVVVGKYECPGYGIYLVFVRLSQSLVFPHLDPLSSPDLMEAGGVQVAPMDPADLSCCGEWGGAEQTSEGALFSGH